MNVLNRLCEHIIEPNKLIQLIKCGQCNITSVKSPLLQYRARNFP